MSEIWASWLLEYQEGRINEELVTALLTCSIEIILLKLYKIIQLRKEFSKIRLYCSAMASA